MGADANTLPNVKRYMLFFGMMISVGVNIVLDPNNMHST